MRDPTPYVIHKKCLAIKKYNPSVTNSVKKIPRTFKIINITPKHKRNVVLLATLNGKHILILYSNFKVFFLQYNLLNLKNYIYKCVLHLYCIYIYVDIHKCVNKIFNIL